MAFSNTDKRDNETRDLSRSGSLSSSTNMMPPPYKRENSGIERLREQAVFLERESQILRNCVSRIAARPDDINVIIEDRERVKQKFGPEIVVYKVKVFRHGHHWFVHRQYSDFALLNKKLKKSYPFFYMKLPGKRIFGSNFATKFLDKRQKNLETYLRALLRMGTSNSVPMQQFLLLDEMQLLLLSATRFDTQDIQQGTAEPDRVERESEVDRMRMEINECKKQNIELKDYFQCILMRNAWSHIPVTINNQL